MEHSNNSEAQENHGDPVMHWWLQRLTAVALVPLVVWFAISLVSVARHGYEGAQYWLHNPFNTILLIAFLVIGMAHAALGMEVVLEDYVSDDKTRNQAILGTKIVLGVVGLVGVVSALRVAFGG